MGGQVDGVQPGFPAVKGVGQGEEAGDVGVPLPGPRQQGQPGAVGQGHLSPGDGLDAQAVGLAGELQGAAQVGVRQGQGGVAVLLCLGQQFMGVGRPLSKGVEALGVEFHVPGGMEDTGSGPLPGPAVPFVVPEQGGLPTHPPGSPGSRCG